MRNTFPATTLRLFWYLWPTWSFCLQLKWCQQTAIGQDQMDCLLQTPFGRRASCGNVQLWHNFTSLNCSTCVYKSQACAICILMFWWWNYFELASAPQRACLFSEQRCLCWALMRQAWRHKLYRLIKQFWKSIFHWLRGNWSLYAPVTQSSPTISSLLKC